MNIMISLKHNQRLDLFLLKHRGCKSVIFVKQAAE